ncbi:PQQ-dependent sugar dehydrogenase [Corynebacterium pacaense]|uniref:PQQ-dependent sugar dehydrogenase n=1 Tax=Corynebacterium pacaense TaxID=1816684 RepID=UPI0009BBE2D9|nr:PQQ-dependent sugar dehydrogenase [Corynebacterium pacaense]
MRRPLLPALVTAIVTTLLLAACTMEAGPGPAPRETRTGVPTAGATDSGVDAVAPEPEVAEVAADVEIPGVSATEHGHFNEGWAMSFLPGTDYLAITERGGALQLWDQTGGGVRPVAGVPEVYHSGQAGLHDIIPASTFDRDGGIYLSWVRPHPEGAQGVVARAVLDVEQALLHSVKVIWEQEPAPGDGHFSLRLLDHDGHLFVTSGDRQRFDPAQDPASNLGKVIRMGQGSENPRIWTSGHRNPLGIDTDSEGGIWVSEMGPRGGDELNHLVEGGNYGWPEASMGVHYDNSDIPDHRPGDGYRAPEAYWVPSISPGSLHIYRGGLLPDLTGSAILGGLSGETLVAVVLGGEWAGEVDTWAMDDRIRAVTESQDGALWVLEDGPRGRLLQLRPV